MKIGDQVYLYINDPSKIVRGRIIELADDKKGAWIMTNGTTTRYYREFYAISPSKFRLTILNKLGMIL